MSERHLTAPPDRLDAAVIDPFAQEALTRFARVGERLGGVQQSLSEVTGLLDELAALVSSDAAGREPLDETTEAMTRLLDLLESWQVQAQTPATTEASRIAGRALEAIHSNALALSAIASMTGVTSGSLGATNLVDYVASLKVMARELNAGSLAVEDRLLEIDTAQARALTGVAAAALKLRSSQATLAGSHARRSSAAAQERAAREKIERTATTMRQAARADIKTLMGAIQFSDSFAQRMDHIGQMVQVSAGLDPDDPLVGLIGALAAAQCLAAAEDSAQTSTESREALGRIARMGRDSHAAFGADQGSANPARDLAAAREAALNEAIAPLNMIGPAVQSARAQADRVLTAVGQATDKFTDLRKIFAAITLSAINATLLTGRSGTARAALGVLASAVQESERACETDMAACERALQRLAAAQDAARIEDVGAAAAAFAQSVERCGDQLRGTRDGLARLAQMRAAVSEAVIRLAVAADAACAEFDQIVQLSDAIRDGVPRPPEPGTLTVPDGAENAVLGAIFATYTMTREREVHSDLLGAPASEAASEGDGGGGGALDDIFF